MARFFVNAPPNGRKMVRLAGADLHHMRNVFLVIITAFLALVLFFCKTRHGVDLPT